MNVTHINLYTTYGDLCIQTTKSGQQWLGSYTFGADKHLFTLFSDFLFASISYDSVECSLGAQVFGTVFYVWKNLFNNHEFISIPKWLHLFVEMCFEMCLLFAKKKYKRSIWVQWVQWQVELKAKKSVALPSGVELVVLTDTNDWSEGYWRKFSVF